MRRGSALASVGHGHSVLPLRRAEVGTCHRGAVVGETAVNRQRRQRDRFAHCRTGPVEAVERDAKFPQSEGTANALVQQIPREYIIKLFRAEFSALQRPPQRLLLHGGFRFFPRLFAEKGILAPLVKPLSKRSLTFHLSADVRRRDNDRRIGQRYRLPSQTLSVHGVHLSDSRFPVGCPETPPLMRPFPCPHPSRRIIWTGTPRFAHSSITNFVPRDFPFQNARTISARFKMSIFLRSGAALP